MTDQDRERSLDETQPIQTPVPAPLPAEPVTPVSAPAAPVASATPAAATPVEPAPPAHASDPFTPAAAVQPVPTPKRGGGARWAVAGVLIVAVVGVAAAAAMLLTGRAAEPDAYAYIPANAAMVMELRPDLPGDQREKLARLVSKFPGFADQSTFETKLDEAIDRFADEAAGEDVDYAKDVKPFLGHPIVIGVTKIPDDPEQTSSTDGFIAIATSSGSPQCVGPADGSIAETVPYAGRTISIIDDGGGKLACVVDGQNVVVGGLDDVKLALDAKGGSSSLANDAFIDQARAQLAGDTLGLIYISQTAFDSIAEIAAQEQAAQGLPPMDMSMLPDWMVMGIRAESDGLLFDAVMPWPTPGTGALPLPSLSAPKVSAIASELPASTIAMLEVRDLGTTIDTALDQLATTPEQAEVIKQLDTALAFLGGRDDLLAWMDDASIVVTRDGATFGGGLVFATPDANEAGASLNQLKLVLGMAGGQGITVADETYGTGTITKLTFDLAQLGAATGTDFGPDIPATFDLAYTVQDGIVVFGVGSQFVKDVMDTTPGQSLADQPRYQAAMKLVGATNSTQAYLDLATGIDAIEELAVPIAGADFLAEWQRDIAPYVEPLDAMAFAATLDGGFMRFRIGLTAHEAQQ